MRQAGSHGDTLNCVNWQRYLGGRMSNTGSRSESANEEEGRMKNDQKEARVP